MTEENSPEQKMSLAEFKAWLTGFAEGIGAAPTPEQWLRVLSMLESVEESKPKTVYRDDPYTNIRQYYDPAQKLFAR